MPRQKNDGRGRLGGRAKGTPNKSTSELRHIIADLWHTYQHSGQFATDLQCLDPAERITVMEKYAQYIAPKMKSVDLDLSHTVTLTIEDQLRTLANPDTDTE